MRDVLMSRPCERRDPSVSAIALIAASRTLVSAPEQRPFIHFEARGYGSLRSQGRPAERSCEATTLMALPRKNDARHHSGGSTASSYSFLKRAINSAAGRILPTLPTPWPLPQISFQAFGLARSPDASVPKLIFDASESGRLSGSIPAATIDGFKYLPCTPVNR